ncbi:MAG: cupin domain-containing protein [Cyanobacteria bacterium HKST-UBA02]|nr:cupin domain-containing protein [Cyanobacteria bacterium HKST-UBA02]
MSLVISRSKYRDSIESGNIAAELRRQGLEVFAWSDAPGATYSPHSHGHDETIVVIAGCIEFEIDGVRHLLEKGDELVLPAGTVHSAVNPGDKPVRYLICS